MLPKVQYKLHHYWRSSCSWRVRWAFEIKKIPCEMISVNLLSDELDHPEYLKKNPMGYVPVLERVEPENSGASPRFLSESVAILEYLEEIQTEPRIFPKNPWERACVRQLVELINAGTQPLQNLNVSQAHSQEPAQQKKWNQLWIRKGLSAYETRVAPTADRFSFGNHLTAADLVLIPQVYNAKKNEVDLSEFPVLARIYDTAFATETCQASCPERFQPEFLK